MSESNYGESVLRAIRRITRVIDLRSKKLARQSGMTAPQAVLMREIEDAGQIAISTLAQRVSLSHATVTDVLNRLASRGLVERTQDTQDKRRRLVTLTDKGRELLDGSPSYLQEQFIERFSELKEWEQTQILSCLQRVTALMDAEEMDVAPILFTGDVSSTEEEVADLS